MDELIKCPVCGGLRCRFITNPYYIKGNNTYYENCNNFELKNICFSNCYRKCEYCEGTGYIQWIDELFSRKFPSQKSKFDEIIYLLTKEEKIKLYFINKNLSKNKIVDTLLR